MTSANPPAPGIGAGLLGGPGNEPPPPPRPLPPPPGLGARFLRQLHPRRLLSNLRNPILQKEVYVAGRRRSTYIVRCVYLLLLMGIVTLAYLPLVFGNEGASGLVFLQRVQDFAPAMTLTIIWFQFAALMLAGPLFLGGSLCDERRSGTLGALLTTPLSAFQIALGKLLAGLSQMVVLVLLSLPLMLSLRIFGGVQLETLASMLAVTLATALLASTLSLFFSARAPRGFSAAAMGITLTLALHGVVTLTMVYLIGQRFINMSWMPRAVSLCSPAVLFMSSLELAGESTPFGGVSIRELCWTNVLYSLSATALAFVALVVRLRRVMVKDAGSQVVLLTRRERRKKARAARPAASVAPPPAPSSAPPSPPPTLASATPAAPATPATTQERELVEHDTREVGDHPVLWRELRQPAFRSRWRFIASLLGITVLFLYMNFEADDVESRHTINMVLVAISSGIMVLIGTSAGAASITQERESRTFDVLMTTPLPARAIIMGKFWGAMRRQWFVPAVILTHLFLSGVLTTRIPFAALIHIPLLIGSAVAFTTAISVYMSARCRKSTMAGALSGLIALGLWLLPFPVIGILSDILDEVGGHDVSDTLIGWAGIVNPVAMATISVTEPRYYYAPQDNFDPYKLPWDDFGGPLSLLDFSSLVGVLAAAYCLLAWLVLWRARTVLGRQSARRA